jgi:hypothetical protein
MGDWGSECESAIALADGAANKLLKLSPEHELLKYWFLGPEEESNPDLEKAVQTEMKNRFWNRLEPWEKQPKMIVTTIVCSNYYLALERAIKEIGGE